MRLNLLFAVVETLPGVLTADGLAKLIFDSPTSLIVFVFPTMTFYLPTFNFTQLSYIESGLNFSFKRLGLSSL